MLVGIQKRPDDGTLQRDKMLTVRLSLTSCFHIRQLFLWPAQFCISRNQRLCLFSEACASNIVPGLQHTIQHLLTTTTGIHAMGCPLLTKIQGWATQVLPARDLLTTFTDFPGYFALAYWLPLLGMIAFCNSWSSLKQQRKVNRLLSPFHTQVNWRRLWMQQKCKYYWMVLTQISCLPCSYLCKFCKDSKHQIK